MEDFKNKKSMIAMSGGVDSSVAAVLLKKAGFEVSGVFLRLFDSFQYKDAEKSAQKIAEFLEIPFFVLDLRKEFKRKVVDYFLKELKRGRTPNPCVVCNKEIKFKLLLKQANKRRFDFIATGHYARKNPDGFLREITNSKLQIPNKFQIINYKLLKAKDKQKDQSYFLWQLNQGQLKHILFPLGDYTKTEIRNLAKKFGILKFVRPESQDVCFIQSAPNEFLKQHLCQKKGIVADVKGKVLGKHQGLCFYTIGQRSGIGIGGGRPYYVLGKDLKRNILIVTRREKDLDKKELICEKVNWISEKTAQIAH